MQDGSVGNDLSGDGTSGEQVTRWRKATSAPKDGSRILVVIRGGEQGTADVDVVRWTRPRNAADPCWTSTDSSADCAIVYEDWEVTHWMPLPGHMPGGRPPAMAGTLPAVPHEGQGSGGSGI